VLKKETIALISVYLAVIQENSSFPALDYSFEIFIMSMKIRYENTGSFDPVSVNPQAMI